MLKFFEKVFGSKKDKDIQELLPLVDEINEIYPSLASLSDEELRGKTQEFRDRLHEVIGDMELEMEEIHARLKEDVEHSERLQITERLQILEKERDEATKNFLDEIL